MELLKHLNADQVRELSAEFEEPLEEDDFVRVITAFAQRHRIDASKLRLRELFNDIDANEDGGVSWEEFSMFHIDAVQLEATLTTSGRDAVIKQYRPVLTLEDEVPGSIAGMHYFKDLNRVIKVVQREKYSKIRICQPTATLPVWMQTPRSSAVILALDYIPPRASVSMSNVLAVSTNDNFVRYHDVSRHVMSTSTVVKVRRQMMVPEAQTALCWDLEHGKLLMGSRSGVVSVVNPDEALPLNTERIHASVISSLLASSGVMYTGSLDSTIKLVDLNRGVVRHTIDGPHSHQQGVFKLGLSDAQQQLFSVGLEPFVYMHSLSNTKMKPTKLVDKNRPHHGRIVSLHVLSDSPQVISADSSGLVKIWDSRTLSCVQTVSTVKDDVFNVTATGGANLSSVGYIPRNKLLCINGRTTKVFGYDTASNPHMSDDSACTLAKFNPISRTFLTVHRTTIKLWDGQTGALRGVHTNVTENEITAVCFAAPRMRKFIAGTTKGEQYPFGYAMCTPLGDKYPTAHSTPTASIVAMEYLDGFKENRNRYILTVFKREVALVPDTDEHTTRAILTLHCFNEPLKQRMAKALAVTDNRTVLVATEASAVYVCDLVTFALSYVIEPTGLTGDVASMTVFPNTESVFLASGRSAAGHTDLNASFAVVRPEQSPAGTKPSSSSQQHRSNPCTPPVALLSALESAAAVEIKADGNLSMPFYRRLGTGVAFVADSIGNISAVLLHSAHAVETIVTWRNLDANGRKSKRRRRHRNNPATRLTSDLNSSSRNAVPASTTPGAAASAKHQPATVNRMRSRQEEEGSGEVIETTVDGSVVLRPSHTLALGEVVDMCESDATFNDDLEGDAGGSRARRAQSSAASSPSKQPRARSGDETSGADDTADEDDLLSGEDDDDGRSDALDESFDESDARVSRLLGSRPNSAVAAYFAEDLVRIKSPTGSSTDFITTRNRTRYAPVVTAMCFLADGHVLVTGDENGYVTSWDVDLVVRKAARHAAKRAVDEEQSVMPTPIASWRAHSDEIVSITEAFGNKRPSSSGGELQTGAVIATAAIDRNIVLWTTDGCSLGNLAQGRIAGDVITAQAEQQQQLQQSSSGGGGRPAVDGVAMPEGIQPYILDTPPDNAWALTDKVRLQRSALAALADARRDARLALRVPVPAAESAACGGDGGAELPQAAVRSVGSRLAERAAGARRALIKRANPASPLSPSLGDSTASLGRSGGSVTVAAATTTQVPSLAWSSGGAQASAAAELATVTSPSSSSTGFFVTELADDEDVLRRHGAPQPSPPMGATDDHHDAGDAGGDDDGLQMPPELRGLVAPDKFCLPLIPVRRTGGKALASSAACRRVAPVLVPTASSSAASATAAVPPAPSSARTRALALAETGASPRTARTAPTATSTMSASIASSQHHHHPQPPSVPLQKRFTARGALLTETQAEGGGGVTQHLSGATQKYLRKLGFDDNPLENPDQKALRQRGRVVLDRPAADGDAAPSLRRL